MRTAILGVGSLGTVLGASIVHNGGDVILIDANQEHVDALNKNGAVIGGNLDLKNVPVHAITPDQMEGIYDIVIVLLKQTANQEALTNLLRFLDENSVVCTLQNGLPEESVAEIVGAERTIGGTVQWGALWTGPGRASLTSPLDAFFIEISSLSGEITQKVNDVAEFLKQGCRVVVVDNLSGIRWTKLLMNAALSGMSAAIGDTMGAVIDHEKAVLCAAHIIDECIRVATANGIKLVELVPGLNFYEFTVGTETERQATVERIRQVWGPHKIVKASMLNDMERGIPCEINYINGEICKYGARLGIDTPFNDEVVKIIKEFEAKKIPFPTVQSSVARFNIPVLP